MNNPEQLDLTEDRLFFLGTGIIFRVVCAPSSWVVADAAEREGDFNHCNCLQCPDDSNRTHWLLNC